MTIRWYLQKKNNTKKTIFLFGELSFNLGVCWDRGLDLDLDKTQELDNKKIDIFLFFQIFTTINISIAGQVASVAVRGQGSPGVSAGPSVQITGNP